MQLQTPTRSLAVALALSAFTVPGLLAQGSMPEGFIKGLQGFDHFHAPIGQPLFFESPLNTTELRPIYLHHEFPAPLGGSLDVIAVQARLAITDKLGFIATKDGYSSLNTDLLPDETGWNNLAAGLKYVAIADKESDLVVTPGFRLEFDTGNS